MVVRIITVITLIYSIIGSSHIYISQLKSYYRHKEKITFQLINNSSESYLYTIGVHKKHAKHWEEETHDIFAKTYKKEVMYRTIEQYQKLDIVWDAYRSFSVHKGSPGIYRFYVIYKRRKILDTNTYISNEFTIK